MNILSNNSMFMMERSMDYLWTKQSCILDNIANVETPGYKAKSATSFEQTLKTAVETSSVANPPSGEMYRAISDAQTKIEVADASTRMDDNGVDVTGQSIELSRNAIQLQYIMDAISSELTLVRTAIRG